MVGKRVHYKYIGEIVAFHARGDSSSSSSNAWNIGTFLRRIKVVAYFFPSRAIVFTQANKILKETDAPEKQELNNNFH